MGRLPEFLTKISPIGETLAAMEAGETLLEREAALRNDQLAVSTAEEGLSLWEKDYSLEHTGSTSARRSRIRTAMAGGQTLTRRQLEALAVIAGGADRGTVEEDFADWNVTLYAQYDGRLPENTAALEQAAARLKPAHLTVQVIPAVCLQAENKRCLALTGGCFLQLTGVEGA